MKKQNKFFYNFLREDTKTITQRIINIFCFIIPIVCAFGGYFISPLIWKLFSKNPTAEVFKLFVTIVFFAIPTVIIFVKTRNANPIMKIRVLEKDNKTEEDEKLS